MNRGKGRVKMWKDRKANEGMKKKGERGKLERSVVYTRDEEKMKRWGRENEIRKWREEKKRVREAGEEGVKGGGSGNQRTAHQSERSDTSPVFPSPLSLLSFSFFP